MTSPYFLVFSVISKRTCFLTLQFLLPACLVGLAITVSLVIFFLVYARHCYFSFVVLPFVSSSSSSSALFYRSYHRHHPRGLTVFSSCAVSSCRRLVVSRGCSAQCLNIDKFIPHTPTSCRSWSLALVLCPECRALWVLVLQTSCRSWLWVLVLRPSCR